MVLAMKRRGLARISKQYQYDTVFEYGKKFINDLFVILRLDLHDLAKLIPVSTSVTALSSSSSSSLPSPSPSPSPSDSFSSSPSSYNLHMDKSHISERAIKFLDSILLSTEEDLCTEENNKDRYIKKNINELFFGVIASKKVGNAVKRNRAKRLLRAAVFNLRSNMSVADCELFKGNVFVLIARKSLLKSNATNIERELLRILSNDNKSRSASDKSGKFATKKSYLLSKIHHNLKNKLNFSRSVSNIKSEKDDV